MAAMLATRECMGLGLCLAVHQPRGLPAREKLKEKTSCRTALGIQKKPIYSGRRDNNTTGLKNEVLFRQFL